MKAIRVNRFGGPEVCELEHGVPVPTPAPGQVLLAVHSVSVNPVDTYVRSGGFDSSVSVPYTPGSDCAGVVKAVGDGVHGFKVGDRVYTRGSLTGTYAEYALAEPKKTFHLHSSLTFSQGAGIGRYNSAYRALFHKADAKAGMTVLVHGGSGGVGIATIQTARAYGLTVLATAGTDKGLQLVRDQGAHAAFCHREQGYQQKILEYTGGKGIDIIVEMAADINLQSDLTLVAPQGKVIVVGCRGTQAIDARLLMGKESAVVGMLIFVANEADWKEMSAALWAGCEAGWVRPVVDKEYALADVPAAHRDLINSNGALGNLVLKVA